MIELTVLYVVGVVVHIGYVARLWRSEFSHINFQDESQIPTTWVLFRAYVVAVTLIVVWPLYFCLLALGGYKESLGWK